MCQLDVRPSSPAFWVPEGGQWSRYHMRACLRCARRAGSLRQINGLPESICRLLPNASRPQLITRPHPLTLENIWYFSVRGRSAGRTESADRLEMGLEMHSSSPMQYSLSEPRRRDAAPPAAVARPSCFSISSSARRAGHADALADSSGGVLGWAASLGAVAEGRRLAFRVAE